MVTIFVLFRCDCEPPGVVQCASDSVGFWNSPWLFFLSPRHARTAPCLCWGPSDLQIKYWWCYRKSEKPVVKIKVQSCCNWNTQSRLIALVWPDRFQNYIFPKKKMQFNGQHFKSHDDAIAAADHFPNIHDNGKFHNSCTTCVNVGADNVDK